VQVATPPTASEFQGGIIGVTLRPVSGADLISPITALATIYMYVYTYIRV